MYANDSDLYPAGINLSTLVDPAVAVLHRLGEEAKERPLSNAPPEMHITPKPIRDLPYDIAEIIIGYLTRDLGDLKACSLACRSWYIAAVPHLHHTLTLRGNRPDVTRGKLKPLSKLYELGLIPLVKEIRVEQEWDMGGWFAPQAFGYHDLRHFSAFTNVHTLKLQRVEIYRFVPLINHYFGHFSSTLRSVMLFNPNCTPRQLSHFLSLFKNLDNIEIERIDTSVPDTTIPIPNSIRYPCQNCKGGWRFVTSVGPRLGRTSLLRAAAYGSVILTCVRAQAVFLSYWKRVQGPWRHYDSMRQMIRTVSRSTWAFLWIRADGKQGASIYRGSKFSDRYKSRLGLAITAPQETTAILLSCRCFRRSNLQCSQSSLLSSRGKR